METSSIDPHKTNNAKRRRFQWIIFIFILSLGKVTIGPIKQESKDCLQNVLKHVVMLNEFIKLKHVTVKVSPYSHMAYASTTCTSPEL